MNKKEAREKAVEYILACLDYGQGVVDIEEYFFNDDLTEAALEKINEAVEAVSEKIQSMGEKPLPTSSQRFSYSEMDGEYMCRYAVEVMELADKMLGLGYKGVIVKNRPYITNPRCPDAGNMEFDAPLFLADAGIEPWLGQDSPEWDEETDGKRCMRASDLFDAVFDKTQPGVDPKASTIKVREMLYAALEGQAN
jgi:hypothetical protein